MPKCRLNAFEKQNASAYPTPAAAPDSVEPAEDKILRASSMRHASNVFENVAKNLRLKSASRRFGGSPKNFDASATVQFRESEFFTSRIFNSASASRARSAASEMSRPSRRKIASASGSRPLSRAMDALVRRFGLNGR